MVAEIHHNILALAWSRLTDWLFVHFFGVFVCHNNWTLSVTAGWNGRQKCPNFFSVKQRLKNYISCVRIIIVVSAFLWVNSTCKQEFSKQCTERKKTIFIGEMEWQPNFTQKIFHTSSVWIFKSEKKRDSKPHTDT